MRYRVLGVAMTLVLLAGCSLIVRSKLDDENGKPDIGLRDGRVDAGTPAHDRSGDMELPPISVEGEPSILDDGGIFLIGERITVTLPQWVKDADFSHVVLRSHEPEWALPCRQQEGEPPLTKHPERPEWLFSCTISAGSPDGEVSLEARRGPIEEYQREDNEHLITTTNIRIVRRVLVAGHNQNLAFYYDSQDIKDSGQQGKIDLAHKVVGEKFPVISPSGRYLLLTEQETQYDPYRLLVVDLVLSRAVLIEKFVVLPPQPGESAMIIAHSFEPELAPPFGSGTGPRFPTFPAMGPSAQRYPFPQYLPERWLWAVSQGGQIMKVDLLRTFQEDSSNNSVEQIDKDNVRQLLWVASPSGKKHLVGLNRQIQTSPTEWSSSLFQMIINEGKITFKNSPLTPINYHHLASALRFTDNDPPKMEEKPIVLVLAYDSSNGFSHIFGIDPGAPLDSPPALLPTTLSWNDRGNQVGIYPSALLSMPGTGLVGFHFMECPTGNTCPFKVTLYGQLLAPGFAPTSKCKESTPCFFLEKGTTYFNDYAPIGHPAGFFRPRVLFHRGKNVDIFDPKKSPPLAMSWNKYPITNVTHHPLRDLVYAFGLSSPPVTGKIYQLPHVNPDTAGTEVDVPIQAIGGVFIQP